MPNEDQNQLRAHIAYLERQLSRYESQEDALVRALAQAKESAKEITDDARRKAGRLLKDSSAVIRDAQRITANARSILEQAELEGQQRALAMRVEADKLLLDTQMYCERLNKETESQVRERLTQLQRLMEDSQRTLESSRARMAYIIRENMDNIRVFMNKITQLRNDSQDEILRASLNDSLHQMQEFLNVFRNDERLVPAEIRAEAMVQKLQDSIGSARRGAKENASLQADEEEKKIWTVDDVMRTVEKTGLPEKGLPGPAGELLSNEALDKMPLLPGMAARTAGPSGRLDDQVDSALEDRTSGPQRRPAITVDERLDDIITRMITTDPTKPGNMPKANPYALAQPAHVAAKPATPYTGEANRMDMHVEGLQLRRGGHSSLGTETEPGERQARHAWGGARSNIRKGEPEALPDDFEL